MGVCRTASLARSQAIPFFTVPDSPSESANFATDLAMTMQPTVLGPNEQVIHSGDFNLRMFVLQVRGLFVLLAVDVGAVRARDAARGSLPASLTHADSRCDMIARLA